jgi:hypothetical protein
MSFSPRSDPESSTCCRFHACTHNLGKPVAPEMLTSPTYVTVLTGVGFMSSLRPGGKSITPGGGGHLGTNCQYLGEFTTYRLRFWAHVYSPGGRGSGKCIHLMLILGQRMQI